MFNLKQSLGLTVAVASGGYVAYRLLKAKSKPPVPAEAPPVVNNPVTQDTYTGDQLYSILEPPSKKINTVKKSGFDISAKKALAGVQSALYTTLNLGKLLVINTTVVVGLAAKSLTTTSDTTSQKTGEKQNKLTWGLVIGIWVLFIFGRFTKLKEWPALFLYVLGTLGLAKYLGKEPQNWELNKITKKNLNKTLTWGGAIGFLLFSSDIYNTFQYYKRGGAPMAEMEDILIKRKFIYLFPVLIVAEEFLWRGLLMSSLIDRGMNKHKAVSLSTFLYVVNHYAVAPVSLKERSLMAAMAVPIGYANGYITLKTKNVWGGVLLHMLTMVSMTADIFIVPKLVKLTKKPA